MDCPALIAGFCGFRGRGRNTFDRARYEAILGNRRADHLIARPIKLPLTLERQDGLAFRLADRNDGI